MNKITKAYIEDYGCVKEYDLFGAVYYSFLNGHFYPKDYANDIWSFHIVGEPLKDGDRKDYKVIDTKEEFEKIFL